MLCDIPVPSEVEGHGESSILFHESHYAMPTGVEEVVMRFKPLSLLGEC